MSFTNIIQHSDRIKNKKPTINKACKAYDTMAKKALSKVDPYHYFDVFGYFPVEEEPIKED